MGELPPVFPEETSQQWHQKQTQRLNNIESAIRTKDDLDNMKEQDAEQEGPKKEAAEKREERDELVAKSKNATDAQLEQQKKALEDKKGLHEIDCPDERDLECLRRRS